MTRIATPENEARVLEIALAATGAQLERICRGFRKATEVDQIHAADRRVRARVLGDGLVRLEVVLSADEADLMMKAIGASFWRSHWMTPPQRFAVPPRTDVPRVAAIRASEAPLSSRVYGDVRSLQLEEIFPNDALAAAARIPFYVRVRTLEECKWAFNCKKPHFCGDGLVDVAFGEQCDFGVRNGQPVYVGGGHTCAISEADCRITVDCP